MNLLIVGFNRSFSYCRLSIEEKWLPHVSNVYFCVSRSKELIVSERAGESGYGEQEITLGTGKYLDQSAVDSATEPMLKVALKAGLYPKWTDDTLKNLIRYLYVLSQAEIPNERTAIIRCDLIHHEDIDPLTGNIFPLWHCWGGLNDRLAILEPPALEAYLQRYHQIPQYCKTEPLHAERFLKWVMRPFRYNKVNGMKASRVRIGGVIKAEKFDRGRG
jgi:hypothetical protein